MATEQFDRRRVNSQKKGKDLEYYTKNGVWYIWCCVRPDNEVHGQINRLYRVTDGGLPPARIVNRSVLKTTFWLKDQPGDGALFFHYHNIAPAGYVLDIAHKLAELARPAVEDFDWNEWACETQGAGLLTEKEEMRMFNMRVTPVDVIRVCVTDPTLPYTFADLQTLADDEDLIVKVCHEFREAVYLKQEVLLSECIKKALDYRDKLKKGKADGRKTGR